MTVKDKILDILQKTKEVRLHDLVVLTGASRQMVHRIVKSLAQKGQIEKLGSPPRTYYRLSTNAKQVKEKPTIDKRIFWDVDFDQLDYKHHAKFIIERVFERGDVPDIRNCRRFYGDEKISDVLLNAKFLPEVTMYLASAVINRPINEFRCFTLRQLNPRSYPY